MLRGGAHFSLPTHMQVAAGRSPSTHLVHHSSSTAFLNHLPHIISYTTLLHTFTMPSASGSCHISATARSLALPQCYLINPIHVTVTLCSRLANAMCHSSRGPLRRSVIQLARRQIPPPPSPLHYLRRVYASIMYVFFNSALQNIKFAPLLANECLQSVTSLCLGTSALCRPFGFHCVIIVGGNDQRRSRAVPSVSLPTAAQRRGMRYAGD